MACPDHLTKYSGASLKCYESFPINPLSTASEGCSTLRRNTGSLFPKSGCVLHFDMMDGHNDDGGVKLPQKSSVAGPCLLLQSTRCDQSHGSSLMFCLPENASSFDGAYTMPQDSFEMSSTSSSTPNLTRPLKKRKIGCFFDEIITGELQMLHKCRHCCGGSDTRSFYTHGVAHEFYHELQDAL